MNVDRDHSVFVADYENRRVVLLSARLELVRDIQLERWPYRLYLDHVTRRLYVGHVEGEIHVIQV